MNTMTADALRITRQDLDEAIRNCRSCLRSGHRKTREYLTEYRKLVRRSHELAEQIGAEPRMPLPIRPQVLGFSPEEKFCREWQIDFTPCRQAKAA